MSVIEDGKARRYGAYISKQPSGGLVVIHEQETCLPVVTNEA